MRERGLIGLVALLVFAGCVDKLSLDGRPCPCLEGWQCCGSNQVCLPDNQICAGGMPCSRDTECDRGQYCYGEACATCNDSQHCGIECVNCALSGSTVGNMHCNEGTTCGCLDRADCLGDLCCVDGECSSQCLPGYCCEEGECRYCSDHDGSEGDAGHDAGLPGDEDGSHSDGSPGDDGGMTDGGPGDGDDGGPEDGDDGGPEDGDDAGIPDAGDDGQEDAGIMCHVNNNVNCGLDCTDCTQLEGNWACVDGRCGCRDQADCLPDQDCTNHRCVKSD
jgi:hypothetical protein